MKLGCDKINKRDRLLATASTFTSDVAYRQIEKTISKYMNEEKEIITNCGNLTLNDYYWLYIGNGISPSRSLKGGTLCQAGLSSTDFDIYMNNIYRPYVKVCGNLVPIDWVRVALTIHDLFYHTKLNDDVINVIKSYLIKLDDSYKIVHNKKVHYNYSK